MWVESEASSFHGSFTQPKHKMCVLSTSITAYSAILITSFRCFKCPWYPLPSSVFCGPPRMKLFWKPIYHARRYVLLTLGKVCDLRIFSSYGTDDGGKMQWTVISYFFKFLFFNVASLLVYMQLVWEGWVYKRNLVSWYHWTQKSFTALYFYTIWLPHFQYLIYCSLLIRTPNSVLILIDLV